MPVQMDEIRQERQKAYKKGDPNRTGTIAEERLAKSVSKWKDFARSTDRVEVVNPEGTWEKIPTPNGQSSSFAITPHGCEVIKFYAANGLVQTVIADRLGMSRSVFTHCVSRQPEVAEALAVGTCEMEDELSTCLMGMARRGNVIAAIYLTKARLGWRDNDLIAL